ncbi:MAG: hypothetical protein M3466_18160 [Gemmatimonadota bacterium]|nr:hypothetical protein [Gemmatimonadota bacterium]
MHRAAAGRSVAGGDLRSRLQAAVDVLEALGGDAQLEQDENAFLIRGYSCPLAAIIPEHPETCQFAVALLSEVVGVQMRERRDKGGRPRCCFEVAINSETAA